jgi:hypothetical protein
MEGWMVVDRVAETDNRVHVAQLNNASYASLTSRAITDTAHGIVDRLIEYVEGREEYRKSRRNRRSEKSKRDLRRAFEGFVGDLLRAYNDPLSGGWVYRSLKPASFTGEAVSYRTFLTVLDGLGGFLEKQPGYSSGPRVSSQEAQSSLSEAKQPGFAQLRHLRSTALSTV